MDNRRERKTSGESTASDSSETASCRPYYLPHTPADCSSSQVVRSASSSSASRIGDYSRSPAGGMSDLLGQMFENLQQIQCDTRKIDSNTDPLVELEKIASGKGFVISDNEGSGNCMFHALSEQLNLVKGIKISHKGLRQSIVQYLLNNPRLPNGTDLFNFVHGYQSWPDYLTKMEQDGTWGDHVILYATANCYKTHICVISSQSNHRELTIKPDGHMISTNPLVLGHVHEFHYVSLQPKQDKSRRWKRRLSPRWSTPDPKQDKLTHVDITDKSREEKRGLSPSWSTPDPKQAKLACVDKTVAFKQGKPGDLDLDELALKVAAKWQKLGLHLGITQDVLDDIEANEKEKPYRMLLHWRNTTTSTALYCDLYYALCHRRVGLNNVAKEFCVAGSEASAEDIFDVKSCRRKLAEHYKRTATVPTSVWSKTSPVDIHQIYTRLSWVKEEQTPAGSSRSELNHYTDVFTANKNGVVPKRILVQGQTGIGKSTFVKKLAVDWAELDDATTGDRQKDILMKFELLAVVNLKEVSKCQSLKHVISRSSIFAREEKYLTDSLLNYINKNQIKVLLVFDGYDEYRCGSNSEVYEIFRGNELRNCCVLITTRISKADELRAFKDMHVEITGFSEVDRKSFMSRMLGGEREAEELSRHLDRQKLEDLAKVPLLLLFFCTLWKKGKSKSFPESKTKLYLAMVQYILDYNRGKDSPTNFGKVHDFEDVLAEIGKVALECLLTDDHVFEYDQLSTAVLCDESLIIGLLQVTEYAENLRPAGMVSFIHRSIQEFLAAWFVTYRCVPEGNLGEIEQHARTLDDYKALENVFQFVCGLSDNGAVKVFQHLTSVRISDPTLDLSKTIPDVENETDVPLCEITDRHKRFSDLVYHFFLEVQSKAALVKHWLNCTAGIILITYFWQLPQHIPKMTLLNAAGYYKAFVFRRRLGHTFAVLAREHMSMLYDILEFFDCLHVPLRITENSAALFTGDFLRQFKTVRCIGCCFNCIVRFHNGKAQFYITELELRCDGHARLFTETIAISTESRSTNVCSKQSCLKFLRYLGCFDIVIAQAFKDLGAVFRNCKHLKTIQFQDCGDAMCELLDHIPNNSTCSLKIECVSLFIFSPSRDPAYSLSSVGAEKLAGVLPRFNVTSLRLQLRYCCAAAVNKLVCSITHKTLQKLALRHVSLTPAAFRALGQLLPEMSSLEEFVLISEKGSILQAEEMEALFGRINETFSALRKLSLCNFNARGSLAPFNKRVHFFSKLMLLELLVLNMDERDLHGLLESLRSLPNPPRLFLRLSGNPFGSWVRVQSMVQQALPQVQLLYC